MLLKLDTEFVKLETCRHEVQGLRKVSEKRLCSASFILAPSTCQVLSPFTFSIRT